MRQFMTLHGVKIENLVEYIRDYVSTRENVEILVGSDSQSYSNTKTVYGVNKDGIILSFFKRVKGAPKKGVSENFNMDLVFVNPLLFESVVSEQDTKTVETENDYYIKMDVSL